MTDLFSPRKIEKQVRLDHTFGGFMKECDIFIDKPREITEKISDNY